MVTSCAFLLFLLSCIMLVQTISDSVRFIGLVLIIFTGLVLTGRGERD